MSTCEPGAGITGEPANTDLAGDDIDLAMAWDVAAMA
jgi:hypothetical protein